MTEQAIQPTGPDRYLPRITMPTWAFWPSLRLRAAATLASVCSSASSCRGVFKSAGIFGMIRYRRLRIANGKANPPPLSVALFPFILATTVAVAIRGDIAESHDVEAYRAIDWALRQRDRPVSARSVGYLERRSSWCHVESVCTGTPPPD